MRNQMNIGWNGRKGLAFFAVQPNTTSALITGGLRCVPSI